MTRQSISLTPPNDEWLKLQVDSQEYSSKSEVINDLIRRAREIEFIRAKLLEAEQSGFVKQSREDILSEIKKEAFLKNG